MQRTIQTTYRYRLNPTAAQEKMLNQFAGARRFVWNWALNRKREHFQQTGKTLSFAALCAELTILKQQHATAWLRDMDSQSLQQALRDLDSAYQHFFRRVRKGEKKKGFPKFKSRKTDMPRFRIPQRVVLIDSFVSVPKIGLIKAIVHRPLEGITKGATFKREACGHWYVNFQCEVDDPGIPRGAADIGIDLGLKNQLSCSDMDEPYSRDNLTRKHEAALGMAQRAHKKKRVKAIHAHIANAHRGTMSHSKPIMKHPFTSKYMAFSLLIDRRQREGFWSTMSSSAEATPNPQSARHQAGWAWGGRDGRGRSGRCRCRDG